MQVGILDFREGQMEIYSQNWKIGHSSMDQEGDFSNFALED